MQKFNEDEDKDKVIFITYYSKINNMVKLKVMTLGDVDKVFLYENDFS
jgi:hypothetical protein